MAEVSNSFENDTNLKFVVLYNNNETFTINAISIFANFPNLIIRRFRNHIIQNPTKKLHDFSDIFQPLKEILDLPNIKILFICIDISIENIDLFKLSYPENEFIKYKIVNEHECLQEYPHIFTKKITPNIEQGSSYLQDKYNTIQLFDDSMSSILPNKLYLTSDIGARNLIEINKIGITHIINVSDTLQNYFEDVLDTQNNPKFKYLKISVPDSFKIIITDYFHLAFTFIDNAIANGGKVLVHCFAGKSRSASIVIGYIMKTLKINFEDALDYVAKKRNCIEPNFGFCRQLIQFQHSLELI